MGTLISALLYPLMKKIDNTEFPKIYWLVPALLPLVIDGGTQLIGLRESTNLLRVITGFIAGYAAVFYLVPAYNKTVNSVVARYFGKV